MKSKMRGKGSSESFYDKPAIKDMNYLLRSKEATKSVVDLTRSIRLFSENKKSKNITEMLSKNKNHLVSP